MPGLSLAPPEIDSGRAAEESHGRMQPEPHVPTDATRSQTAKAGARAAWRRGQAALHAGDAANGLRWLDRACRLAPQDPTLHLGLATAWLGQDPARAVARFTALSAWHDSWESGLGLAVARMRAGDARAARAALAHSLSRHAAPVEPGWMKLADAIAPSGWCALTQDGTLRLGPDGLPPAQITSAGLLHVRRDGQAVVGSPIDQDAIRRRMPDLQMADPIRAKPSPPARPPPARIPAQRGTDIIIPVYRDHAATLACLDSVLAARPRGVRVIVIDDATPEPALAAALDRLAARRRIFLLRHARNRGFPAAANAGLAQARATGRDALLLNADTLVAPGFLARLRMAAYAAADIGTACPLSNNATILNYPDPAGGNPMPDLAETRRLAALAWAANGVSVTDIPTAVGFCMYLRHDCLRAAGRFRADLFGRGYGEENDFCQRASAVGWRHVAATGVFVAHAGEVSFGTEAADLRARNETVLLRLHPDYPARIAAHVAADPLFLARRRLDEIRWQAGQMGEIPAVVLITHALGGGVARSLAQREARLRATGMRPVTLAPSPGATTQLMGFPNLRFRLPDAMAALAALLGAANPAHVEFHHMLGHHPALYELPARLGVPHQVYVHDYHWFCPRVVLSGSQGRYCGEPDLAGCNRCIRQRGSVIGEAISVAALRVRSAHMLAHATRVMTPSTDAAARISRHFPGIVPRIMPWDAPTPTPTKQRQGDIRRIAVIGAIGAEKGYHVLLALARDAAAAGHQLEFVVIGHTIGDAALLRTGHAFITGPYAADEAVDLIRDQAADLAFVPSVVPETWCHALSEAWAAGLHVVAFDLGAQAERIRATGQGSLLPAGLAPSAINHALLAARW